MTILRWITIFFAIALIITATLNYIPGLTDDRGYAFGIFALDIFDDLLHLVSATWAAIAAFLSHRTSRIFLLVFGTLYLGDGVLD